MTSYLLTNRQREYFGLNPIEEHWEQLPLKNLILFFDENVIRKVVCYEHSKQFGYSEFDYVLPTDARQKLLPASSRGKPKPLTPGNILDRNAIGFSFSCLFGWKGKTFDYQHFYVTHIASDSSLVSWDDHGITTCDQLAAWVEDFIASCPTDHLQKIEELREQKRPRIRYQPGDVFEIPFDHEHVGYGRILLDVHRLRHGGLFDDAPHCGLGNILLGSGLLVEILDYCGTRLEPGDAAKQPVLGTLLMMHDDIYRGRLPIVGHKEVACEELDFPEGVSVWHPGDGTVQYYFQKGGMAVPVSMTDEEFRQTPKIGCAFGLNPSRVRDAVEGNAEARRVFSHDLRKSDRRADILKRCELDPAMSYAGMVAAKGGIPPEEFINASK